MEPAKKQVIENRFHTVGRIEGASMLILLFIAMPLKYAAGQPEAVLVVGSLHGVLWLANMLLLLQVWIQLKWPFGRVFLAGIASVLPFGPWVFEAWQKRKAADAAA